MELDRDLCGLVLTMKRYVRVAAVGQTIRQEHKKKILWWRSELEKAYDSLMAESLDFDRIIQGMQF